MTPSGSDRLLVQFEIRGNDHDTTALAAGQRRGEAIAIEQSLEMPLSGVTDPFIRDELAGRLERISADDDGTLRLAISLDTRTCGHDAGQLMNMLFGNVSLQPDVMLTGIDAPTAWLAGWPGPRFGLAGLRAATGVPAGRALTCSALKPQGLAPDRLAALAATLADAGIDVIKDDHGIADQRYAPFEARVAAVQTAIDRVNARRRDGRRTLYAPTISGSPARVDAQTIHAHRLGVGALLACPMLLGPSAFAALAQGSRVPVIAHPALAGATRIAPAVLLGTLFRLFGADAGIFPNAGGRFSYDAATCRGIVDALRGPLGHLAPALPVPAGGMTLARVPEMVSAFGPDQMLLIGGNLLEAPAETGARAARFVRAVDDAAGTTAAASTPGPQTPGAASGSR